MIDYSKNLIEIARDAIVGINENGIVSVWNKAAEKLFGYSKDEIIGQQITSIIPERYRDQHKEGLQRFVMTGEPRIMDSTVEVSGITKKGAEVPIEMSLAFQKNEEGKYFFIAIIRDLTERKKAERRLNAQHAVTQALSESNTIKVAFQKTLQAVCEALRWDFGTVWMYHQQSNDLRYTELWHVPVLGVSGFTKMTKEISFSPGIGLPGRVWASGKPAWINDVVEDPNFPRASVASKVGLHGAFGFPIIINKEILGVIEFFSKTTQEPDEDLLSMMTAVGSQVGIFIKRKHAEEQIRRLTRAVEQSPASVVITDTKGDIEYVNKKFTQVTGYTYEEVIGKNPRVLKSDETTSEEYKELWETITSGKEWRGEFKNKDKDGKNYWESASISPIKNDEDVITGFIAVKEDITEHKKLEQQLVNAQKLESIGQLAAGVAHEINTPTQYILDNTNFLKDAFRDINKLLDKYSQLYEMSKSGPVTPELTAEIDVAIGEADVDYLVEEIPNAINQSLEGLGRVKNIVSAMKNFSHPDNENKRPVDINEAIRNTITVASNEWKYVAEVKMDFDSSLTAVPCFPGDFNQVILNLIVNAAHAIGGASENGSEVRGIITISTSCDGDWAEIRVSDTGTGIPEDIRDRVFDPFFTTKEVGKGTGQGLSLAYSTVVERHKGTITLDTEIGKGTTFIIRLPLSSSSFEILTVETE